MKNKLDSEDLGIITRNSFLEEFFPEQLPEQPQSFTVYHYNGLPQSCPGGKVRFAFVTLPQGNFFFFFNLVVFLLLVFGM